MGANSVSEFTLNKIKVLTTHCDKPMCTTVMPF